MARPEHSMRGSPRLYFAAGALLLGLAIACGRLWPQVPDFARGLLFGVAVGLLLAALLKSRLPDSCDTATPALRRRYLREFMPAMAAYVVAVLLSTWLLRRVDVPALRALVALMPVPAIALAMRAIVRYIRDSDELQRRIELEAVSIATACVSLSYLAAGFLQSARVIDIPANVAMIWMFPLVCLTYGVAKLAVMRRYG
jgi:hypothetical protein